MFNHTNVATIFQLRINMLRINMVVKKVLDLTGGIV